MNINDDRKQWRSVMLDYDKLIVSPENVDECQYCLTAPQVKALIGIVELWRYKTRWFYEGTIEPDDVEQFVNDIQRRLMMSCCGDSFDQGLAAQRAMEAFEFFKLDDGTPQSYAPDTRDYFNRDSTNSAEDTLRNNQLCIAVRDWVYAYIQEYLKYLGTIGAVLGAAAGIAFYTGNPVAGFIFGISAAIIDSLGAIAVTDAEAVNKVICCMINGLKEQTVTQEHFRHSLDSCGFSFGTKEAQLAGALNSFNQTDENYRAFLVHLGHAKTAAVSDTDQCPSCEETHCGGGISDILVCWGTDLTWIDDCTFTLRLERVGGNSGIQWRFMSGGVNVAAKYSLTVEGDPGLNHYDFNAAHTDCTQEDAVSSSASCSHGGLHYTGADISPLATITITEVC